MMRLAFIYTVLYFMYMYNIILHLTDGHRQMSITVIAWATEDQILISVRTDMVEFGPVCSRTGISVHFKHWYNSITVRYYRTENE